MASTMNFEICHLEDVLSISSHDAVLPKFPLDLPFFNDYSSISCNDSDSMIDEDILSMFSFPVQTTSTKYTSVPIGFLVVLCMEFLFLCSLWTIALWPAVYSCFTRILRYFATGYTLTFVGIKPPRGHQLSTHWMFPRIDTTKTIQTVYTKLQSTNTIHDLKVHIKSLYAVPNSMDVLVVFAHHIISNDALTLNDCGIADRSLLTLALCPSGKVVEEPSHFKGYTPKVAVSVIRSMESDDSDPVEFDPVMINAVFEMNSDDDDDDDSDSEDDDGIDDISEHISCDEAESLNSEDEESVDPNAPRRGFDVVMQEDDVTVYQMAACGHEMNPESLYHYALSQYLEKSNLAVKCPHFCGKVPCPTKWEYHDILTVLRRDGGDYDLYKLELLASRNRVQSSCDVQKCPKCNTLYFQNEGDAVNLGEIDTAEAVERAFKSECVYCTAHCRQWQPVYDPVTVDVAALNVPSTFNQSAHRRRNAMVAGSLEELLAAPHLEDDVEELIDGNAVNAMFGHYEDSDDDTDSDSESGTDSDDEEEMAIIQRTNSLFADDDDEDEPTETVMDTLYRFYTSTLSTAVGALNSMKGMALWMCTAIHSAYCYLSTTSILKMDEDLNSLMLHCYEFMTSKLMRTRPLNTERESVSPQNEENTEDDDEWIDGDAVNAMFGTVHSDDDTDDEEMEIIARTNALFDDDDDDEIESESMITAMTTVFVAMSTAMKEHIASIYKLSATRMAAGVHRITTELVREMDLNSSSNSVHDVESVLYGMYILTKWSMASMVSIAINIMKREEIEMEEDEEAKVEVIDVVQPRRHRVRRRRVDTEAMDLYDGGLFGTFSDDEDDDSSSDDDDDDVNVDGEYFEYIEQSDYDSVDSDTMEERLIADRISHIFEGDGISEAESGDEMEEKEVFGYDPVMRLHGAFCFGCGDEWVDGHVCDSSFKRDLCDILQMAEKKTIGEQHEVPSIRCCPTCCQLITHTQACKHMDCRNCRKSFCFVCLKLRDPKKGWQCGSYSSKCPGGVVPPQGMESLPDAIVITKNAFQLY